MDKTIHLSITQDDIDCAEPTRPSQCAIARAFKRTTGINATVSDRVEWMMPNGQCYWAKLNPEAIHFVLCFDSRGCHNDRFVYAKPFELDLVPVPLTRVGVPMLDI